MSKEVGSGISLAKNDYRRDTIRCDGCGGETAGATHYKDENDVFVASYCPGCEVLRRLRGIEPGEHEQYKLQEVEAVVE